MEFEVTGIHRYLFTGHVELLNEGIKKPGSKEL